MPVPLPPDPETSTGDGHIASVNDLVIVASHPLGVKPSGNAYTTSIDMKAAAGALSVVPDEILIQIFEYLDAPSLSSIGSSCKALHAFSRLEDFWKSLCLECCPIIKAWNGSWRNTYLDLPEKVLPNINCSNLFSDALYRPFLCAHINLIPKCDNIPPLNEIRRISSLSSQNFVDRWTDEPFILTDVVKQWPVYRQWSIEGMLEQYSDISFRAESVDWSLKTYVEYMQNNVDETPLYLFDRCFVEKTGIRVNETMSPDYWPPECFGEDLFSVLEDQRPDSRWLIIGPERSGSSFHKDPNATSAWNAVLRGSKYWIMFPSSANLPPPPGVFVSDDQSEVTSPLSIAEWLLEFHTEARETPGCKEAICREGELLHVPSGWWHLVVNLEPSIALTQNFVPVQHLPNVLEFLKTKSDQVSGFSKTVEDPYLLFVQRLKATYPNLYNEVRFKKDKKRKWEDLVNPEISRERDPDIFSFAFAGDDDAEVP